MGPLGNVMAPWGSEVVQFISYCKVITSIYTATPTNGHPSYAVTLLKATLLITEINLPPSKNATPILRPWQNIPFQEILKTH